MTTSRRHAADVIVVGGGPAGSMTALLLARRGLDVLLLDRARFPRAKPCGDCLSAGAGALLERLGVLAAVLARPHAMLEGWRIIAPDGAMFESRFASAAPPCGALAIERAQLDDALLGAARAAGVRIDVAHVVDVAMQRGRVTGVITRERTLHAPVVVGADGLRSVVAARLGLRRRPGRLRKVSLTYHADVADIDRELGEMHSGDGFCAGLAPVSDTRCNLTIVADSARYGRAIAAEPQRVIAGMIGRLPRLAPRIDAGAFAHSAPHACGPFDRPVSRIAVAGAVLVGDAAGYYDPFTGQGVYQAIACAELLAHCIAAALRDGRTDAAAFAGYVRGRARVLRGTRLVQRGVEAVLSRPALANHMIARIGRAPSFARTLIAVTGDVARPVSLLAPDAWSSLLLPPVPERT